MSLLVSSLNSGSNGNCYYIGNSQEAILVDGGISCRAIEKRLKRLGLSIRKVKGIFVSHEHGDHVHGIPSISRKYQLPVYITDRTLQNGYLDLAKERIRIIRTHEPVTIGSLTVTPFPIFHDASDPHNFVVASDSVRVGIFTDIGRACPHVVNHFKQCHAAFLEANYDDEMLNNSSYPLSLRDRIRGGRGHLSNRQAAQLFVDHKPTFMSHLFLSHLSEENNCPTIVEELFSKVTGETEIVVTSRHRETPVYSIYGNGNAGESVRGKTTGNYQHQQLSLF